MADSSQEVKNNKMGAGRDEANRRNSKLSTGPRTAEGKAKVALNALRHGLTGRQVVLPNEDPEEFDTFRAGLLNVLQPHDELEGTLAEKIVVDAWRLRRVVLLESAAYRRGYQISIIANQEQQVRRYEYTDVNRFMDASLEKTKVNDSDRQAHADALVKLSESRSKLNDPSLAMIKALRKYSGTFEKLSRYEAGLSRSS